MNDETRFLIIAFVVVLLAIILKVRGNQNAGNRPILARIAILIPIAITIYLAFQLQL